jgi:hypothetical protein
MTTPLGGGCLCGAIRYTVNAPISALRACHCTHCQKASGTGASINATIPSSSFSLTQGKPRRFEDKADSGRTLYRLFCGDCGSPIYSQRATMPEFMVLKVGTLDHPVDMRIVSHIWTRSARPWNPIDPALEQHPEGAPPMPPAG